MTSTARTQHAAEPLPLPPHTAKVDEVAAKRVLQGEHERARPQLAALYQQAHVADHPRRPRDGDAVEYVTSRSVR